MTNLFSGSELFELKATHGLPLDVALNRIINEEKLSVNWVEFIETARKNKWWDFQTYEVICNAMIDAELDKQVQTSVKQRFQLYVVSNKHPLLD